MKITREVRVYATGMNTGEMVAAEAGMSEKIKAAGGEIYLRAE